MSIGTFMTPITSTRMAPKIRSANRIAIGIGTLRSGTGTATIPISIIGMSIPRLAKTPMMAVVAEGS